MVYHAPHNLHAQSVEYLLHFFVVRQDIMNRILVPAGLRDLSVFQNIDFISMHIIF